MDNLMDKTTFIDLLEITEIPKRQSVLTEYATRVFNSNEYTREIFQCIQYGICTHFCQMREFCPRKRIKFLIHAIVTDLRNKTVYPHEYLNETAILRRNIMIDEEKTIQNRCVMGL